MAFIWKQNVKIIMRAAKLSNSQGDKEQGSCGFQKNLDYMDSKGQWYHHFAQSPLGFC